MGSAPNCLKSAEQHTLVETKARIVGRDDGRFEAARRISQSGVVAMVRSSCLAVVIALLAAPASAEPGASRDARRPAGSIRLPIDGELARLAAADAAVPPFARQARPARTGSWVQRHPVGSAAIAGFLSGFALGWAAGDDAVFDDFTGEFNGVLLVGIVAGSAASMVAIVQAVRR